jgi:hypothetical protein
MPEAEKFSRRRKPLSHFLAGGFYGRKKPYWNTGDFGMFGRSRNRAVEMQDVAPLLKASLQGNTQAFGAIAEFTLVEGESKARDLNLSAGPRTRDEGDCSHGMCKKSRACVR